MSNTREVEIHITIEVEEDSDITLLVNELTDIAEDYSVYGVSVDVSQD